MWAAKIGSKSLQQKKSPEILTSYIASIYAITSIYTEDEVYITSELGELCHIIK